MPCLREASSWSARKRCRVSEGPGASAVQLPQWQGYFDTAAAREGRLSALDDSNAVRVGPLTVVQADRAAAVFTFGNPARPSVVVFDGYLVDRGEQAIALGFGAGATTDAELFAAGYARWGTGVFREFEGRYLVAMWDSDRRRFLLAHDALGRHPSFYAIASDGLWFGSNVLALASNARLSNRPNRLSLALGLLTYWPEAGQTFFEAIRRVRPGHYLEVTEAGTCNEHEYWDPLPAEDEDWLPDAVALEQFEPALARSVARCMALQPQGIMLSGGVDSVTIAALAMKYSRDRDLGPLVAVCARTGYALSGEERMQTVVAEALAMPIDISTTLEWRAGRDNVSLSLDLAGNLPSPTHIWWVGTYTRFYKRTAALGLNVLLTGAGGDNWLGVAERHAADLLRAGRLAELVRFVRADVGTGGAPIGQSLRRLLWAHGARPHLEVWWAKGAPRQKAEFHRRRWHARLPAWLCPDPKEREALVERLLDTRTPALASGGTAPKSHYRHYFKALRNPYLHHENETAFHIESATGLILLSPYHDRTLVSFLNRISPRLLLHGARYKGLLRPVAGKYLRGLGLENQRKAYERDARERDLREFREGLVRAWPGCRFRALGALGLVDERLAAREIDGVSKEGYPTLGRMFAMMSHEHWLRAHEARGFRTSVAARGQI
jgi:asparagine synthetase B (glutamine-hydrolysing)